MTINDLIKGNEDKYIIDRGLYVINQCGFFIRVTDKETGEILFKCDRHGELKEWFKQVEGVS